MIMRPATKSLLCAGIPLSLLAAVLGYQAWGVPMFPPGGQPSTIVTVRLATVMEKLNQHGEAEAVLHDMAERLKAEHERRRGEVQKMQDEFKAMPDETPAKQELKDKIDLALLNHQAWYNFSQEKLDVEAALRTQDLYRNVKAEVARMSITSGFDLVLVDDSQGELSTSDEARMSRQMQIMQQIGARRMLYVNQAVLDITDQLIERMNNADRASGAKPPAN